MSITSAQMLTGSVALPTLNTWYLCSKQPTDKIAYVVTYTTVATTSTPGFGTIVQHIKISPNLTASTGLLSAVLQVSELYKYMSDQYNEFLPPYSCCCDVRVIDCVIGSSLPPLPTKDIYCLTVRNPNAFTSYANIGISFDQVVSTTTPPPPSPTPTTSNISSSISTTSPYIPTVTVSITAGSNKDSSRGYLFV
ncbi:9755_t:CDS:2 [Paraglomus brasilianum]|uniref:9755_t:CDS:1 n=1 Tax=Paraglomus brasilianum TaxID=144538 RepID=A0A9N8VLV1_9GLOM|nr:9755_t:CDS:2 [Paraglomus brasilianum]